MNGVTYDWLEGRKKQAIDNAYAHVHKYDHPNTHMPMLRAYEAVVAAYQELIELEQQEGTASAQYIKRVHRGEEITELFHG